MTKQQTESMETKEGAELGFSSLAPVQPLPWGTSKRAEAQQTRLLLGLPGIASSECAFQS